MAPEGLDRAVWLFSLVYGGLTVYSAFAQVRLAPYRKSCSLMIAGGLALLAAIGVGMKGYAWDWALALAGCAAMCAGALWNGRICGVIDPRNHIFRILFCVMLIVGFAMC